MNADDTTPHAGGSQVERGVRRLEPERADGGLRIIHISWAGPEYWISVGNKVMRFEDHRYCGPIVVGNKTGDPMDNQPNERHKFWLHYDAWAKQGKKTKTLEGKVWCDYKTELQAWRRSLADSKPPNVRAKPAPTAPQEQR
jgi:hypothetical protein